VNEVPVTIHMKLDDNGAAYFVEIVDTDEEDEEIPPSSKPSIFQKSSFKK
jgi:phosphatidate phosphatase PAH1